MNHQSVIAQQLEIWQALCGVETQRQRKPLASKKLLDDNYRLFLEILKSHLVALECLVQTLELRPTNLPDLIEAQLIRAYAGDDEEQTKIRDLISLMPNLGRCVHTSLSNNLNMVIRGLLALVDPSLGYHATRFEHEIRPLCENDTGSVRGLLIDPSHIMNSERAFLKCMSEQASPSNRRRWERARLCCQTRSEESLELLQRYDRIETEQPTSQRAHFVQ